MILGIFPENISTYGKGIDDLFWLITAFVAIAFFISLFVLLYPVFNNGEKKVKRATYFTGQKKKHFRWISIALVALTLSDFVILFAEHGTWATIEQHQVAADLHVAITGRQWNWIFTYPGADNKLYTADDISVDEMNSELHVPVNKNIVIDLRAKDVVHSFFVSNIRLKQDAIPGRNIQRWFNCTKEGKYNIACAEICGILHYAMRNFLVVESQESFNAFMNALIEKNKPIL